ILNIVLSYKYTDPNNFSGYSYYRLRQVDFDGSFVYTPVRVVEGMETNSEVTVFPNPTYEFINLRFDNQVADEVRVRVIAANGQVVYEQNEVSVNANTVLRIEAVQDFPAGTYLIQVNGKETDFSRRFIKVSN